MAPREYFRYKIPATKYTPRNTKNLEMFHKH